MLYSEFTKRTGVEVSNNEYQAIHEVYVNSDLDKDGFCKMWCKMNASRVKDAKVERMIQKREAAYKESLNKWFRRLDCTQYFF